MDKWKEMRSLFYYAMQNTSTVDPVVYNRLDFLQN